MKNNPNFFSQMISSACMCKPLYLMKTFPSWAYVDNLVLFHVILPSKLQYFTKKVSKNVDSGKSRAENESHDRPPSHLHKTKSSKTKKQQNS